MSSADIPATPQGRHLDHDLVRAYRDDRAAARAAYVATDKGRARHRRTSRASRVNHPQRSAANTAVINALRDGSLLPAPCSCCGANGAEAHHPDYSRPLDVVWLCKAHHTQLHVEHHEHLRKRGAAAESTTP